MHGVASREALVFQHDQLGPLRRPGIDRKHFIRDAQQVHQTPAGWRRGDGWQHSDAEFPAGPRRRSPGVGGRGRASPAGAGHRCCGDGARPPGTWGCWNQAESSARTRLVAQVSKSCGCPTFGLPHVRAGGPGIKIKIMGAPRSAFFWPNVGLRVTNPDEFPRLANLGSMPRCAVNPTLNIQSHNVGRQRIAHGFSRG